MLNANLFETINAKNHRLFILGFVFIIIINIIIIVIVVMKFTKKAKWRVKEVEICRHTPSFVIS